MGKRLSSIGLAGSATCLLLVVGATSAVALDSGSLSGEFDRSSTLHALSEVDSTAAEDSVRAVLENSVVTSDQAEVIVSTAESVTQGGVGEGVTLNAVFADGHVAVPGDPAVPVSVSAGRHEIEVGLPFAATSAPGVLIADGIVAFENRAGFATVPLVKSDASVQFTTVIHEAEAPDAYTYDFPGSSLELGPDGLVTVRDSDGHVRGLIAAAWAVDGAGSDVATHYVVDGSTLTQIVDHAAPGTTTYPVVADPYLGIAQIESITTTRRDPRGVTKVVTPTAWGRLNGNNPTAVNGMRDEYLAKVTSPYRTNGMWWQLACHMQFAPVKSTWNLDSYVVRTSYADYIAHACN